MSLNNSILCPYFLKPSTNANLAKSGDSDGGSSGYGGGCRGMITVSCQRGNMWIVSVSVSMSINVQSRQS